MLRHGVYLSGVSGHQERVGSACYLENYSHTDVYISGVGCHEERVGSACYLENYSHTDVYISGVGCHQERVGSACYLKNYSYTDVYQECVGSACYLKIYSHTDVYLSGVGCHEERVGSAGVVEVVHGGSRVHRHQLQRGEVAAHDAVAVVSGETLPMLDARPITTVRLCQNILEHLHGVTQ